MFRWLRFVIAIAVLATATGWLGASSAVNAQGQVYQDSMDSSATGLLSSASPDPARFVYGYQNSQFIIQAIEQGWNGDLLAFANVPSLPDVSVKVDFSIAGDLTGKYAFVGCRAGDDDSAYMFEVHPDTAQANIWRFDPGNAVNLATVTDPSVVTIGSANNTVEIRCQGSTITGFANGTQLLTVQDATYTAGDPFIGTGKNNATTDTLLTGFDNLVITDLGNSAAAQTTQAPVQPTQAPVQPTQPPAQPTQAPVQPTVQAPPAQPTQAPLQPTAALPPAQPTTSATGEDLPLVPYTDPAVDPAATLDEAFFMSLAQDPVYESDGASGELSSGRPQVLATGASLTDFYAELYYVTPPADPAGMWTVGFCFWGDANGNCYELFISSNGTRMIWGLGVFGPSGYEIVQSGELPAGAIDLTPGAENELTVAVYQGTAMLSTNTFELDASFAVPGQPFGTSLDATVAFIAAVETETRALPMSVTYVGVWDMSSGVYPDLFAATETPGVPTQPAAQPTVQAPPAQPTVQAPPAQPTQAALQPTTAPATGADATLTLLFETGRSVALASAPISTSASGVLTQSTAGFNVVEGGVATTNFYATATFTIPADLTTRSDMGIGFRDILDNQEYRFVVLTDGTWGLSIGTGTPFAQGTVANLNTAPGATNTIELVAQGTIGIFAVNGVVVQQLDLSANANAGDVYIASGLFGSTTVEGRQVPYSNFSVYALPA